MKNVLVTGGAGFVGSHLIEALLKEEYQVYSIDNYSTGKKENHIDGARYFECDTSNIDSLQQEDLHFDTIFHLGEYSRIATSFNEIKKVFEYNLEGTFKVLEYCRKNDIKLIYAGSSTKFGAAENDDSKGENLSPYAWMKAKNTELIKNYNKWYDLDYAITYFYNVYGPRQIKDGPYATVIGIFEDLYKQRKPMTVVKPGTQMRDFTHVNDIVRGLILVSQYGEGDGYCFGTGKSRSILDVATLFSDNIEMIPQRLGERSSSEIDFYKSSCIGWKAEVNLENYIKDFKVFEA